MTALGPRPAPQRLRRHRALLLSCALGTGVALAQAGPAHAQAVNANPSSSPFAPFTRSFNPGEGTETIRVSNPSTVIDWTPTSAPNGDYEFLPAGNVLTFQGPGDYAVLNRLNIAQPVRFDGSVISQSLDASGAITGIGGTILFSAPSGIIIGSTAIFDVGNLVLTTLSVNDVVPGGSDDGYGNFDFIDADGTISLANFDGASGGIVTEAGAQIRANAGPGGFVALIAPNVDHSGSILVSGTAALIGGNDASINLTPGQLRVSSSYSYYGNSVVTRSGSLIDASSAPGGNVVLTAPSVTHAGAIRVDGQAALVAGRSVEVSISQANGLFNIAVPVGVDTGGVTPGGLTVTSTGSIGGPASTGAGDPHAIYLVGTAQPFGGTDPITILLDGAIGFDPAGASVENGAIVIAAGYNVTDGEIDSSPAQVNLDGPNFTGRPGPGDIRIDNGSFTSDIVARAYGDIEVHGGTFTSMDARADGAFRVDTANAAVDFSGDLAISSASSGVVGGDYYNYGNYGPSGPGTISITATDGRTLHVGGNLSATALPEFDYAEGRGESAYGGSITMSAEGDSSVIIDGGATLDASAEGFSSGGAGGYGYGGSVTVQTAGGTIQVGGDLNMLAGGVGGDAEGNSGGNGGGGIGGNALISSQGSIAVGGNLNVDVTGVAGVDDVSGYGYGYGGEHSGAEGIGGSIEITSRTGGTISITGDSTLDAYGIGGPVNDSYDTNRAGAGRGGRVLIGGDAEGGSGGLISFGGTTDIDARGIGGDGPVGGDGLGGRTFARSYSGGQIVFTGGVGVDARGIGGVGAIGEGGSGYGGYASLSAGRDSSVRLAGSAELRADGIGGDGVTGGGAGIGGAIASYSESYGGAFVIAYGGGQVSGTDIVLSATGTGGAASDGAGGEGTGGTAQIQSYNDADSQISFTGEATLDVAARGGAGTTAGGAAQGGEAIVIAESGAGAMTLGDVTIGASARGGDASAGAGGAATGGGATVGLTSGLDGTADDGSLALGTLVADASARGGDGTDGGDGTAGTLELVLEGGTLTAGDIAFTVTGAGGNALAGGIGGDGSGGAIIARFATREPPTTAFDGSGLGTDAAGDGANATIGDFVATSQGIGGAGGTAGGSTYGTIDFSSTSSILAFDSVDLSLIGAAPLDQANTTSISINDSLVDIASGFALTTPGAVEIELTNAAATDNGAFAVTASNVTLVADLASLRVAGPASFDVSASGAGAVAGGNVSMVADNSSIAFDGGLSIDASASGTISAAGGSVSIDAFNDSSITSGATDIDVTAAGAAGSGANASGGIVSIRAGGDSSVLLGGGTIDAGGTGGSGSGPGGGDGSGGFIFVSASDGGTAGASGALDMSADGRGGDGPSGGIGTGGGINMSAAADGGALSFADLAASASGIGGAGATGAGGAGIGGDIFVLTELGYGATGAGVAGNFESLSLVATGTGGDGVAGGIGTGGEVRLASLAGSVAVSGDLALDASATGGTGTTGAGGDASGGLAFASAGQGASLSFGDAVIDAGATGGDGATGGTGTAGISPDTTQQVVKGALLFSQGTVTGNSATLRAIGTGGAGTAGAGGAGIGGTAQISASSGAGPSTVTLASADLDISARGGDGTAGGGNAEAGTTGVVVAQAINGTLTISDSLAITADAAGGDGGSGDGGDAIGGFFQFGTASGPGSGTPTGSATFGTVTGTANATGGAGANGGDGIGGALALLARGSGVTTGAIAFAANGTGGDASTGTGGTGAGGEIDALITPRFQTTDPASADIASFTGTAIGTGGAGPTAGQAQYGAFFFEVTGSSASFGAIDLATAGDAPRSDLGDTSRLDMTDSDLVVANQFSLDTPGRFEAVLGGADASFGGFAVTSAGTAIVATNSVLDVTGAGTLDVTGGDLALTLDGSQVTFAGGTGFTVAGGDFTLSQTGGTASFGDGTIDVDGGDATLTLTDASTSFGELGVTVAGGNFALAQSGGTSSFGDTTLAVSGGDLTLGIDGGDASFGAAGFNVTGGDLAMVLNDAGATFADAAIFGVTDGDLSLALDASTAAFGAGITLGVTGGDLSLGLDDGAMNVSGDLQAVATGAIDVAATGTGALTGAGGGVLNADRINFSHNGRADDSATVTFTDLAVQSAQDIVVDAGSALRGDASVTLSTPGSARIAGLVAAPFIEIASSDIDLPATGFIGDAATETVNFDIVENGEQTVIGGDADGPGFTLTNDEASRIRAGLLRINAPALGTDPGRDPDLVIRDLTLSAAPGQSGTGAVNSLEINVVGSDLAPDASGRTRAPAAIDPGAGIARVEGGVVIANADETSQLLIEAGGLLTIVTPDGSLRVLDADGNPTGEIGLASANIWAASQDLLDRLAADPDFTGRDDALLANDGAEQPRGYIEGGDVSLFVRDTLFVQNSGNADSFAGITVTGDLTITPSGQAPLEVQAFGRRLGADGGFTDNSEFFRTVDFEAGYGGGFTDTAEFNLCGIVSGVCPGDEPPPPPPPPPPEEEPIQPPTQDQVTEPVDDAGDDGSSTVVVNINQEFDENSVFDTNELIEEPVTSGGDVGAWGCDNGDEAGNCGSDRPGTQGEGSGGGNGD